MEKKLKNVNSLLYNGEFLVATEDAPGSHVCMLSHFS